MKRIEEMLRSNAQVTDYKINLHEKKSYEMFFVKGKLETVRCTDTKDTSVTVYVAHGEYLGNADFTVYPSTTDEQLLDLVKEAVEKALLINNKPYTLPENETGDEEVESNFVEFRPDELAAKVANTVFGANDVDGGSLNSVEVFINRHHETVINSRGIRKSQVRYDAMVEAIPTYSGNDQSVELYEQYNFSNWDEDTIRKEIADKMLAVKGRYEAHKPEQKLQCNVLLNTQEVSEIFSNIARMLNYAAVYSHSTVFRKGEPIQKEPTGDLIEITMMGEMPGNVRSSKFDSDGMRLSNQTIVKDGIAVNYYGSNRYGQYLGEKPTGNLPCLHGKAGTMPTEEIKRGAYLEIISMSGLQVDFFSDYIGGEIRLAYYCDGEKTVPVTGISISGAASEVLRSIQFADTLGTYNGCIVPEKALLNNMKIF